MSKEMMTLEQFRKRTSRMKEDSQIQCEVLIGQLIFGLKFEIIKVRAVGSTTDEPMVILQLKPIDPELVDEVHG